MCTFIEYFAIVNVYHYCELMLEQGGDLFQSSFISA